MNLYKFILVDDEEEVRQAIIRKLDWASIGFEVVGEAANGEEALELCEQLTPDVVMTDIKMPFMDGLTFCRRVKQLLPGVKTAIFSGFDEFEYAKEAIKLEVEEYILKPINAQELEEIFRRIKAALDLEIAKSRNMERLRHFYEESLPMMRQQLLLDLLEGRIEPSRIEDRLREFEVDIAADEYCVAVLLLNDDDINSENRLFTYSLQSIVTETLSKDIPFTFIQSLERLILLFSLPAGIDIQTITARLNQLFPASKKLLGIQLSIGLGHACTHLHEISRSYFEAMDAIEYENYIGTGHCIYIGDIKPVVADTDFSNARYVDDILRQIKVGRKEDLEGSFRTLLQDAKASKLSRMRHQMLQLDLTTELLKLIKEYQLEKQAADLNGLLLDKSLTQFDSVEKLLYFMLDKCEQLRVLLSRERKVFTKKMVETAQQYIGEHFADSDLSVDTLCNILSVSPAYFSTIFKKETGDSFVAYLTHVRMEKAIEYLSVTDDKTYIIAEKVGYADPNYFSYVFKKKIGCTPSKYRTDRMKGHDADKEDS